LLVAANSVYFQVQLLAQSEDCIFFSGGFGSFEFVGVLSVLGRILVLGVLQVSFASRSQVGFLEEFVLGILPASAGGPRGSRFERRDAQIVCLQLTATGLGSRGSLQLVLSISHTVSRALGEFAIAYSCFLRLHDLAFNYNNGTMKFSFIEQLG